MNEDVCKPDSWRAHAARARLLVSAAGVIFLLTLFSNVSTHQLIVKKTTENRFKRYCFTYLMIFSSIVFRSALVSLLATLTALLIMYVLGVRELFVLWYYLGVLYIGPLAIGLVLFEVLYKIVGRLNLVQSKTYLLKSILWPVVYFVVLGIIVFIEFAVGYFERSNWPTLIRSEFLYEVVLGLTSSLWYIGVSAFTAGPRMPTS